MKLRIKSTDDNRTYDGTSMSSKLVSIDPNVGKLKDGDTIRLYNFAVLDKVGSIPNTFEFQILRNGIDVTHEYDVVVEYGTLTFLAPPLTPVPPVTP